MEELEPQPLAESSPKLDRPGSASHAPEDVAVGPADVSNDEGSGSDTDSLGEEVLSEFQMLVSDAKDRSRSMSSLDGWGTPSVSPEKMKELASCINELDEQKEMLFSALTKLECSSAQRALGLGKKLSAAHLEIRELQEKSIEDAEVIIKHQDEVSSLRGDVETLLTVLSTAFCDGEWQWDEVELATVDPERLPGKHGALSVEGLQVLKVRTKLSEQRSELDAYRQEVTRLRDQQTADLQQQFEQLQQELTRCRMQGEGLHGQLSVRETELQQLTDDMSRLTHELAEKDQSTADDHALIQQLQRQYESCFDETTKLKSTIESLEPQVTNLAHEVSHLEKELAVSQSSGHVAQQQVEGLRHDLESVQQSAAQDAFVWQTELERRDAVLDQLRQELVGCRQEYVGSCTEVHDREEKISQLELLQAQCTSEILQREKTISELEANLGKTEEQAKSGLVSLQQRKEEVEQQLHCRDQLLAAISVELSAIRRHYKDCCEGLHQLDTDQQRLTEQRDSGDRACAEAYAQIDDINEQLAALDNASDQVSVDYVDGLAEALSSSIHTSQSSSPAAELRPSHASLQSSLELRTATLQDLRGEIGQCQALFTRVSDHIEERKHYVASLQPAHQHTEEEVQVCHSKIEQLQQQLSELKEQRANKLTELAVKDEALERVQQERQHDQQRYDACAQQLSSQEQNIERLAAEQDDIEAQVAVHVEKIYQLRCDGVAGGSDEVAGDGDEDNGSDATDGTLADHGDVFKFQSKMEDYRQLAISGGSERFYFSPEQAAADRSKAPPSSTDSEDRQQAIASAMVQREEALAWLQAHHSALQRLQEKKAAEVERRRLRIVQLEQQLGVVK